MYVLLLDSKTETLITPDTNPNPIYTLYPTQVCSTQRFPSILAQSQSILRYPTPPCLVVPSQAWPCHSVTCSAHRIPAPPLLQHYVVCMSLIHSSLFVVLFRSVCDLFIFRPSLDCFVRSCSDSFPLHPHFP